MEQNLLRPAADVIMLDSLHPDVFIVSKKKKNKSSNNQFASGE